MKLSRFGEKFTKDSGILRLMGDLGEALASSSTSGERMLMLGGGNPARIPEVEAIFRDRIRAALEEGHELDDVMGSYDAPQGNRAFLDGLASLLNNRFGWKLDASNIALTAGSQTSFFFLFNLLGGTGTDDARKREILLPLTPEYIGYADAGIEPNLFRSARPEIELIGDDLFKYHVDFDRLNVGESTAAICVSRPTNPTSNVLTSTELERLSAIATGHDIPLIIDNAYGTPFPHVIFNDAEPIWNENIILTMSLSKLGLPGVRTGIVVAEPGLIRALTAMNAIVSLEPGSFGAFLARDLVTSGRILDVSKDIIRPFYERKSQNALAWLRDSMKGIPYRVHKPEGTFFFWIWFEGLPVTAHSLYERLKARGVLVLPGHYFFPGLDEGDDWRHRQECIRLNYATADDDVRKGLGILAEEVRNAYD